ncbi:MAG: hypothetical protein ABF408_09005 [Bifidobacterium aquikefiri]
MISTIAGTLCFGKFAKLESSIILRPLLRKARVSAQIGDAIPTFLEL